MAALSFRLAARQLLHFFLLRAARSGALCLRGRLLARCAFQFLSFCFLFDLLGVCNSKTLFQRKYFTVPVIAGMRVQW